MINTSRAYTEKEELFNTITHVLGMLFSVSAISILVTLSCFYADCWSIVSCSIFGASMFCVYTASVLYHAVKSPKTKAILKKLDHIAIYYLIAGSYTPFMLVPMRSTLSWIIFSIIWTLAIAGTILKIYTSQSGTKFWSVGLYLLMGWLVVFVSGKLFASISTTSIIFLVLGGLFYSGGVVFYVKKQWMYSHAVWHMFVLMGTIMHFFSILFSCVVKI